MPKASEREVIVVAGREVTVTNPFDDPLDNVQVTDTLYFLPTGSSVESQLQTTPFSIGTIAPHGSVGVTIPCRAASNPAPSS